MKIDFPFRKLKILIFLQLIILVYNTFSKSQYIEYEDNKAFINTNLQSAYIQYEQMPQFPGGEKAMIKFIKSNLKYPDIARKIGASGTVIINFVVESDGKISNIKVIRGIGSGCDEEAVRIIKLMPDWIPGKNCGKAVSVGYTVPVRFVKPIEADELSQLIAHDKSIELYVPAQKMQIIKNREKIGDSIKVLSFKEYRESDSRDYQFCYSFIDYTPQNKYIRKILDDKLKSDQFAKSAFNGTQKREPLRKYNVKNQMSPDWYPLTFFNGDFYNFRIGDGSPLTFTDSTIYNESNYNNPFIINELRIMDNEHLKFMISVHGRHDSIEVYFTGITHQLAIFRLFDRRLQLYVDFKEINSFPTIVCVASQWKDLNRESERIESEAGKLPDIVESFRERVNEIIKNT
jgi:TonB family protein